MPSFFLATVLIFFLLGALALSRSNPRYKRSHFTHSYVSGQLVKLVVGTELGANNEFKRFEARVISLDGTYKTGKVLVSLKFDEGMRTLRYGDTILSTRRLKEIRSSKNPGAFDFRAYAKKRNFLHQLYLDRKDLIHLPSAGKNLSVGFIRINERLQNALEKSLGDSDALGVSKALMLGNRKEISDDLTNSYKDAGAMHLLAISGLHVGIILLILSKILTPILYLPRGRILRMILVVCSLWFYAILVGLSASVVRAVTMFSILSVGHTLARQTKLENNLVVSMFILLLIRPRYLFDVGFQLSYAALFGIALTGPVLRRIWRPRSRVLKYVWDLSVISCSAQLGVLPLSIMYFNQFSGLFLFSSLFILPFMGLTLVLGFGVIVLSVFEVLPPSLGLVFENWLGVINTTVEALSKADFLIFREIYFPVVFCLLFYAGYHTFCLSWIKKRILGLYVALGFILIVQVIWFSIRLKEMNTREFVVFNQYKESLIIKRSGKNIKVIGRQKLSTAKQQILLKDYIKRLPGRYPIHFEKDLKKLENQLFYLDSTLVFILNGPLQTVDLSFRPDLVILMGSPKVNLERLLLKNRPKLIVADGSNYFSTHRRWQKTCDDLAIDFHRTNEEGAFIYPTGK